MNFFCLYITNGITKKFCMNKIYCHIYQNYLGRNTCHYRDKIETKQCKTIETKNKSYFMNKSVRHVRNLYHGSAIKCTVNVKIQNTTKYNSPDQLIISNSFLDFFTINSCVDFCLFLGSPLCTASKA